VLFTRLCYRTRSSIGHQGALLARPSAEHCQLGEQRGFSRTTLGAPSSGRAGARNRTQPCTSLVRGLPKRHAATAHHRDRLGGSHKSAVQRLSGE
jgi:hypothetical protein